MTNKTENKKEKKTFKQWLAEAKEDVRVFCYRNPMIPTVLIYGSIVAGIVVICKGINAKDAEKAQKLLEEWKANPNYYDSITGETVRTTRELTAEELKEVWYEYDHSIKTLKTIIDEHGLLKKEA